MSLKKAWRGIVNVARSNNEEAARERRRTDPAPRHCKNCTHLIYVNTCFHEYYCSKHDLDFDYTESEKLIQPVCRDYSEKMFPER